MSELNRDALKAAAEEFVDAVDDWQQFGCTKEKASERIVSRYVAALPKQEALPSDKAVEALSNEIEQNKLIKLFHERLCDGMKAAYAIDFGLPKQEQSGWMPIETLIPLKAQKKVKNLFWLDWAPGCGPSSEPMQMHNDDRVFCGKYQLWSSVFTATHWQPLPTPPDPPKGEYGGLKDDY